jgi:hypothetical protein
VLRWIGVAIVLALFALGGVVWSRGTPTSRSAAVVPVVVVDAAAAPPAAQPAAFQGERALADLRDLVAIGPRPAGSPGAARARALIAERLRQAGWPVSEQAFSVAGPGGRPVEMVNLIGSRRGQQAGRIVLGTHYDTKDIAGMQFLGANDGASGVALLLELARALGRAQRAFGIDLVFFDGEEAFGPNITGRDGLYGSNAMAAKLAGEGALDAIQALILVDMIGDRDLNLGLDSNSDAELLRLAREIAAEQGHPTLFDPGQTFALVDDHMPFRDRGLARVLALIDFQFGAKQSPGPLWHTEGDNLQAVSAESLNRVGRVVVELVTRIEGRPVQTQGAANP